LTVFIVAAEKRNKKPSHKNSLGNHLNLLDVSFNVNVNVFPLSVLIYVDLQDCNSYKIYYERKTPVLFSIIYAEDIRFKFIFIAADVCLRKALWISYQNKQKIVINPSLGFMNTSASNFIYCRIVVGCQQRGNNGPASRSQNPFVNISHSICVEKCNLCIRHGQARI